MNTVAYVILVITVLGFGYYAVNTLTEHTLQAQQRIIQLAK